MSTVSTAVRAGFARGGIELRQTSRNVRRAERLGRAGPLDRPGHPAAHGPPGVRLRGRGEAGAGAGERDPVSERAGRGGYGRDA